MLKRLIIYNFFFLLSFIALLSPAAFAAGESDVIGTVPRLLTAVSEEKATFRECTLGDAMADAAVKYTGADMAIINGGDLTGNLQPGDITMEGIRECIAEDRMLALCEITPAKLREILESALSHVRTDGSKNYDTELSPHPAFPQVSGFRVSYDPAAEAGNRVARITVNDKALDLNDDVTVYTLAATEEMLSGAYGLPAVSRYSPTGWALQSLLVRYIQDGMDEYILPAKRVYAMEIRSGLFASRYSIFTIVMICCLLFALTIPFWTKLAKWNRRNDEDKGKGIFAEPETAGKEDKPASDTT